MVDAEPAYVDTSAYVKLYDSREPAAKEFLSRISKVRSVTSSLLFAEVHSAFARKFREGDLNKQGLERVRRKVQRDWKRILKVRLTEPVLSEAERLLYQYDLRAPDSIHLASASLFRRMSGTTLPLITADQRMAAAAVTEGFSVEHFGLLSV